MKAYPFDRLIEGTQTEMILETVEIMKQAIERGVMLNLIINNRVGGNASLIAQEIALKFLGNPKSKAPHQMNLWDV